MISEGKRRPRILVVDDERSIADTLATIFRMHGYDAVPAYSGDSGLQQASRLNPDMIVSDVMMPGIDGAEMAIQALQFLPNCKILLISGQAATTDLLSGAATKGYTFELLAKPVQPSELLERASRLYGEAAAA